MDIQALRIFVDVMKHGSFAAVARHRDLDPSSVSRSISALKTKPGAGFIASRLVPRRFHVCASPSYLGKWGRPANPRELEKRDCLLFPMQGYRSAWKFRPKSKKPFEVPVTGHLIVSHGLTMTACAVQGLGPALLPDWLCRQEVASGELVNLFPDYECAPTDFDTAAWLVYPSRDYIPLKLRALIDFLRQEVTGYA